MKKAVKELTPFEKHFKRIADNLADAGAWELRDRFYANKVDYRYFYNLGKRVKSKPAPKRK